MFLIPRDIETQFRHSLGAISPLMCIADIASQELTSNLSQYKISKLSKKYKHKRLNARSINIDEVSLYVNLAHIAYINSRAESFCEDVVCFIKKITGNTESYNVDSVDFLRKAIFQVYVRKNNLKKSPKKLDKSIYIDFAGQEELLIIDYFRRMRNVEFHGGVDTEKENFFLSEKSKIGISLKFKHCPNNFDDLNIRDIILYSQAWQSVAKTLCSKLIDIDDNFLSKITKKYINDDEKRRNNALRQKLKQDYLQPDYIIDMLETNGWVA
ncbi:MAG: hypothetical protein Q9M50_13585 [Methylococcales bacterium]|nr:hypothetical protein [Methylococcales bacterium]